MQTTTVESCSVCLGRDIDVMDAAKALNRCQRCGFVFDSPRPTVEALVEFYSRATQYDGWVADREVRDRLWRRRVEMVLRHSRPGNLLDIGAGIGQFLAHARPHFDHVTGTEVSDSAVRLAKQRYGLDLLKGQVEVMDVEARFDNITIFHVLEHVPDPARTVARCVELLKPGGMLFVAVPNELDALRPRIKQTLGRAGIKRYAGRSVPDLPRIVLDGSIEEIHLSHFTVSTLRRLLERHGLVFVEAGLDPYSVAQGKSAWVDRGLRAASELIAQLTGRNVYDAIWMVARAPDSSGGPQYVPPRDS